MLFLLKLPTSVGNTNCALMRNFLYYSCVKPNIGSIFVPSDCNIHGSNFGHHCWLFRFIGKNCVNFLLKNSAHNQVVLNVVQLKEGNLKSILTLWFYHQAQAFSSARLFSPSSIFIHHINLSSLWIPWRWV